MKGNYLVKKQAREYLNGNWGAFIAAFFLLFIPMAINDCIETCAVFFDIQNISLLDLFDWSKGFPVNAAIVSAIIVIEILIFALFLPLFLGITKLSMSVANGSSACFANIFYFFKRGKYMSALHFNLSLMLRKLLWTAISFIPAMLCTGLLIILDRENSENGILLLMLLILGVLFFILGVVLSVLLTAKYFLAGYLFVKSDGKAEVSELIHTSISLMRQKSNLYISLLLSFLPWICLCLFVFPAMYVMPYMSVSFANSAKWIIKMCENQPQYQQTMFAHQNSEYAVNNIYSGV